MSADGELVYGAGAVTRSIPAPLPRREPPSHRRRAADATKTIVTRVRCRKADVVAREVRALSLHDADPSQSPVDTMAPDADGSSLIPPPLVPRNRVRVRRRRVGERGVSLALHHLVGLSGRARLSLRDMHARVRRRLGVHRPPRDVHVRSLELVHVRRVRTGECLRGRVRRRRRLRCGGALQRGILPRAGDRCRRRFVTRRRSRCGLRLRCGARR
jgi:hypothetical protein